jgi:CheY-like chemotaxis protein
MVYSGRDLLRRLDEAADIDVLLIDSTLPDPGLVLLLAQLRADRNGGLLPVLVTAPGGEEANLRPLTERYQEERQRGEASRDLAERFRREGVNDLAERYREETARREESLSRLNKRYGEESASVEENLRRLTERQANITVISASQLWDEKKIGQALQARLAEPANKPLTAAEGKDNAAKALEWLVRLGRGEMPGYDLRPAASPILKALGSKELAALAVEAAGHLPGPAPQRELANVVLDQGRPEGLRSAAAIELCHHMQLHGLLLTPQQVAGIETLYAGLEEPKLKGNVALVLGSMHPDARQTGERLRSFKPALTTSPAKPAALTEEPKENK